MRVKYSFPKGGKDELTPGLFWFISADNLSICISLVL